MSNLLLPNLYIAGIQKCGTTSLFDWLATHPSIYGPLEAKDFPIFAKSETFSTGRNKFAQMYNIANQHTWRLGAEANALFAPGGVERMNQLIPDARIIVLLRNPVTRCVSAWRFARERFIDERSFSAAIESEIAGNTFADNSYEGLQMNYIRHGLYSKMLRKLEAFYPPEQITYLIYEEFFHNPAISFAQLLKSLDLDNSDSINFANTNKTATSQKSRLLSQLLYNPNRESLLWQSMTRLTTQKQRAWIRRNLRKVNRRKHSTQSDTGRPIDTKILDGIFTDDIQQTEAIIGRNLNIWR